MPVREEVVTRFTAQDAFTGVARKVQSATQSLGATAIRTGSSLSSGLGASVAIAGGGLLGLGTAAVMASARMDSLKRGLISVAGSSEEANRQLARLKEIARLPGLAFEEAVEMSTNLQSAGLSAGMAESAMMEFGNALAIVGRGKADLNGVALALTQIAGGARISQEEINQLRERVPQITQVMKRAFGTSNTEQLASMGIGPKEFISKVLAEMQRSIPRATGGIQASFDNLADTGKQALAQIGDAVNDRLIPVLDTMEQKVGGLIRNGTFKALSDKLFSAFDPAKAQQYVEILVGGIQKMGPVVESVVGGATKLIGLFTSLPPVLQQAIGMLVVINKFTGGMVTGMMSGIASGKAGGALGSALQGAILGPLGMIGTTLIIGALSLADKVRAGIELLEMKEAMKAAEPEFVWDYDEKGRAIHSTKRPATEEDRKAAREKRKKQWFKEKFGLDFDEPASQLSGIVSNSATQSEDQGSAVVTQLGEQTGYLKQIADNTGDKLRAMVLGGTHSQDLTPVEISSMKKSRKSLPDLIRLLTTAVYAEGYNAAMGVQLSMYRNGQFAGARR